MGRKGPGPGVMPWSLLLDQQHGPPGEQDGLRNWQSLGGKRVWGGAKMELLGWVTGDGLELQRTVSFVISITNHSI